MICTFKHTIWRYFLVYLSGGNDNNDKEEEKKENVIYGITIFLGKIPNHPEEKKEKMVVLTIEYSNIMYT